eukprot:Skav203808  [mRNA]  locus=scaffold1236:244402:244814:+ [translate_table: standard]
MRRGWQLKPERVQEYQRLEKPDFTKSFSYIRNGSSLSGPGSIFEASMQRRPRTAESALEEPLACLG